MKPQEAMVLALESDTAAMPESRVADSVHKTLAAGVMLDSKRVPNLRRQISFYLERI